MDELAGPAILDVWLAQVPEEPMEPLLPIVDPHHHLYALEHACIPVTRACL